MTISEPLESLTWRVGQQIHFEGSAVAEEGDGAVIAASRLYWKTRLLHCPFGPESCHRHPLQVFPATTEGSFFAPDHDYPSKIELTLTATDTRGLAGTKTVTILPKTVDLQIASDPAGIELTAGPQTKPTPFPLPSIEGSITTLSAPESALVGGISYLFEGWSDGGSRVHTIVADASAEYRALYGPQQVELGIASDPPGYSPSAALPPPLPQPLIGKRPKRRSSSHQARFTFSVGLSGLGFRCKLDRAPYRSCRSPKVYKHLAPGSHTFRVEAYEAARGRAGRAATFKWRIL